VATLRRPHAQGAVQLVGGVRMVSMAIFIPLSRRQCMHSSFRMQSR